MRSYKTKDSLDRVIGTREAADFCNYSLVHFRRLIKDGKVPPPMRLVGGNFGWRIRTLVNWIKSKEI